MLTWLEINSRAIQHNLRQFKKIAGRKVLLMPVIKANAYGHGFLNVAKILQKNKETDRVCVASLDEALELIKNKLTKKPIMILSFFDQDEKKLALTIKNNVIFPLYSLENAGLLNKVGESTGKKVKVHLKIDTGASRLGILPREALDFIDKLKKYKKLYLEGIWSHFASSEDDFTYTKNQHEIFQSVCKNLKDRNIFIPIRHIACSAATLSYKFTHENALRLGLSLYGLYPSSKNSAIQLKPALSWYTAIIQVKTLPTGTKIGYGGTYTTKRPTKIAVLPVGYWDGYDRRLSNHGYVLIKGKKCPILGRICMNICMVDVTNLSVKAGDKVVLVGKDKTKNISVDDLAKWCGTINYEIVDRINPLLPRV
ncbi:MAG: Alanine racemase [Parcubacteria group bacterium Gr01-1014_13]|nr:MAG: Alanine racemase [Parcubacteria group bacterium Gr01-1014_13]